MITEAYAAVTAASTPYEARWTLRALLARNPDLYADFREQQQLWCEALVTGEEVDVHHHTEAMVRGWQAIYQAMDGCEDDAYVIGRDDASGVMVAIGDHKAIRARVEELYGEQVVCVTPAEVATLLARSEVVRSLKGIYPGSELLK